MNILRKNFSSTDVSIVVYIEDDTAFTPETGLVYNTAGLSFSYLRQGGTIASITLASLSAVGDAHTDGGFIHIGEGHYRLDLPDAVCASGADWALVYGASTNMIVKGVYLDLDMPHVDTQYISANVSAAGNLQVATRTMVRAQAATGTLSSTAMTTTLTETTDGHYVGRAVIWTSGALTNAQAAITGYDGTTKQVQYSGGTPTGEAPSNGDYFIIV